MATSPIREPLYSYFISAKIYKTFLIKKFVSNKILYIFALNKTNKTIKIMKTYLKTSDKQFYTAHLAFDQVNLTKLQVSNGSIEFKDDIEDLEELLNQIQLISIREGFTLCTREEFNEVLIRETKRLNEITKNL